jgi:hypothetical protein
LSHFVKYSQTSLFGGVRHSEGRVHQCSSKMVKIDSRDRCGQVFMAFGTRLKWLLVVVNRRSLFRGSFNTKIAYVGFKVVVVKRRALGRV